MIYKIGVWLVYRNLQKLESKSEVERNIKKQKKHDQREDNFPCIRCQKTYAKAVAT